MDNKRPFNKFLSQSLEDMRGIVDSSKVLGDPIYLSLNEVIIPISKLTFGFGVGGTEFSTKKNTEPVPNDLLFETSEEFPYGGGSLGGLMINPEAFLYIKDGDVRVVKMGDDPNIYERILDFYKDIIRPLRKK